MKDGPSVWHLGTPQSTENATLGSPYVRGTVGKG